MIATEQQIKRVTIDYSEIAQEPVKIEIIGESLYAFGSELAVLRLFHKLHEAPNARAEYSQNLKAWYYTHEMRI